eukprot:CAMPEP_0115495664 /NCGR_PEP_ID=MMETSP0271-20121206/65370_1 /TAXON_ID=71861 /ORGANISM="Scrippsiella trochoidea, Strain CCMP3099" /LENGTH=204 /DNA_ID=CAMNT_0002924317 /DNA_START=80 /DNA_END=691 /DNA_ORIENTATION=-
MATSPLNILRYSFTKLSLDHRPSGPSFRNDGVVQNPARTTNFDLRWSSLAPATKLRLCVNATMPALSEVVLPRYPDVATLAPIGAPGVLNLPIFVALLRPVFADAEAHQCNSMVNDGIPPAQVHDARIVDVPDSPCRDGDGHRALLDEGGHDGGELVLWELHMPFMPPRADNLVQACDPGSIRHGHSLGQGSLCSGATLRIVAR